MDTQLDDNNPLVNIMATTNFIRTLSEGVRIYIGRPIGFGICTDIFWNSSNNAVKVNQFRWLQRRSENFIRIKKYGKYYANIML